VGYTTPKIPKFCHISDYSRSRNWRLKSQQAKSKTTMFIMQRSMPNWTAFTECIGWRGYIDPLSFVFHRLQISLVRIDHKYPSCGSQAVSPDLHQIFFTSPIKDLHLEEAVDGFEHPWTDHVISENQLSISSQNIHDPRSAQGIVMRNVQRANNFSFGQLYMIFPMT
jgi:hypothetical protein